MKLYRQNKTTDLLSNLQVDLKLTKLKFCTLFNTETKKILIYFQDLKELLDKSSQGFIMLSLGSVLRCSTLPEHIINAFIKTFSKLPYLVLWKIEDDLPSLPQNVITKKWLPINDVLGNYFSCTSSVSCS